LKLTFKGQPALIKVSFAVVLIWYSTFH